MQNVGRFRRAAFLYLETCLNFFHFIFLLKKSSSQLPHSQADVRTYTARNFQFFFIIIIIVPVHLQAEKEKKIFPASTPNFGLLFYYLRISHLSCRVVLYFFFVLKKKLPDDRDRNPACARARFNFQTSTHLVVVVFLHHSRHERNVVLSTIAAAIPQIKMTDDLSPSLLIATD